MILLISDDGLCALRTALSNSDQKIAFLQTDAPLFSRGLQNILEDTSLEIAVIECMLHDRKGLKILGKIKRSRADVPVLFVCSSDSDHLISEAFKLGARDCFKKPVDLGRLKERIAVLRKLKSAARERRASSHPYTAGLTGPTRATTDIPDNILRAMNYIEDHVSHHALGIVRLAKVAGMSTFHFCRVFKKYALKTPMQYLSCLRVEKAKDLLKNDSANMSVSRIATRVGFYDSSNLNKHFKRATGLTPTAFKRSLGKAK